MELSKKSTLVMVLFLLVVPTARGKFVCGETVCEGDGYDTCHPHPINGRICLPCSDFQQHCNSTHMPQGCTRYCLDQQKTKFEDIIYKLSEQIKALKIRNINLTKQLETLQHFNSNLTQIVNETQYFPAGVGNRVSNLTEIITAEKSSESQDKQTDYQAVLITLAVILALSLATNVIVIVCWILKNRSFREKTGSFDVEICGCKSNRRPRIHGIRPTDAGSKSELITSSSKSENTHVKGRATTYL